MPKRHQHKPDGNIFLKSCLICCFSSHTRAASRYRERISIRDLFCRLLLIAFYIFYFGKKLCQHIWCKHLLESNERKKKKKPRTIHTNTDSNKGSQAEWQVHFSCAYKHFNLIYKTKWPGRVQQTGNWGLIKENPGPVWYQSNLHLDHHFSANATFTVFDGDFK